MKILSYILRKNSPLYGDKGEILIQNTNRIKNGDSSNNSLISISAHSGTHIDAPYHFYDDGKTLDQFEPKFWHCENPFLIKYEAKEKEIISLESVIDRLNVIPDNCDVLLFKTGFGFYREFDKKKYIFNGPGISSEIGFWLRENRKIKMICLDTISLSAFSNRPLGRDSHKAFLSKYMFNNTSLDPILIIEDVNMLDVNYSPKKLLISPLLFEKADGAPVTIFAYDE